MRMMPPMSSGRRWPSMILPKRRPNQKPAKLKRSETMPIITSGSKSCDRKL